MRKKTLYGIITVLVAGVLTLTAGIGSSWFTNGNIATWFNSWGKGKQEISQPNTPDNVDGVNFNDSMIFTDVESDGVLLNRRLLEPTEYSAYGIDSRSVQSVYCATVTLENHNEATNRTIKLDVQFSTKVSDNEWLRGLSASGVDYSAKDYIQLSKTSVQSGEEFTITCTQAFGAPIIISATAEGAKDGDPYATCSIQADYIARFSPQVRVLLGSDRSQNYDGAVDTDVPYEELIFTLDDGNTQFEICDYDVWFQNGITESNSSSCFYAFVLDYSYGVGTIKDTFITPSQYNRDWGVDVVVLPVGEEYIEGAYDDTCVHLNSPIADIFFTDDFFACYDFELADEWGHSIDSYVQQLAGGDYSSIYHNYGSGGITSKKIIATMYITFTGAVTGETYRYGVDLCVNPQYLAVPAENPSFDIGNIIF